MDRKRARRLVPVPRDYRPGYPVAFSLAQYHELVAPRLSRRVTKVAASLAVACAACGPRDSDPERMLPRSTSGGPEAPADLRARVLSVYEAIRGPSETASRLGRERIHRANVEDAPPGSPRFEYSIPVAFGNSYQGIFDVALARERARALFSAYGFELEKNVHIDRDGVAATIDGFDARHGVGFELRDVTGFDTFNGPSPHTVAEISDADRFDDDEARRLADAGSRIHVAKPYSSYGDEVVNHSAYLLSLIAFLDEVTVGPDFDVATLLDVQRRRFAVTPRLAEASAGTVSLVEGGGGSRIPWRFFVRTTARTRVILALDEATLEDGVAEYRLRRVPRGSTSDAPEWTAPGRECRVGPPMAGAIIGSPARAWSLIQTRADGTDLRVQGRDGRFELPAGFDVDRPFLIEIDVDAGEFHLDTTVLLGAPPP